MKPKILATFEKRNMLSLLLLMYVKYFLGINWALFRDC